MPALFTDRSSRTCAAFLEAGCRLATDYTIASLRARTRAGKPGTVRHDEISDE
jgi:hypothetical protein